MPGNSWVFELDNQVNKWLGHSVKYGIQKEKQVEKGQETMVFLFGQEDFRYLRNTE